MKTFFPYNKMKELHFKERQCTVTLWENRVLESFRLGFKPWLSYFSTVGLGIGMLNV